MGKKEDYCFRQLAYNYVLLTDIPRERFRLYNSEFQCLENDNALLTYGYIDHDAGLTFEILCFAKYKSENVVELRPGNPNVSFKIRYDGITSDIEILQYDISMAEYKEKVKMVQNGYRHSDDIEEIRKYEALDLDRHPQFPDDVGALAYKVGYRMERMWVRTEKIVNGKVVGTLLNQPKSDVFGLNRGDFVTLVSVPAKNRRYTMIEPSDLYL